MSTPWRRPAACPIPGVVIVFAVAIAFFTGQAFAIRRSPDGFSGNSFEDASRRAFGTLSCLMARLPGGPSPRGPGH
ncbi:hypothetical protein HPP92_004525 [Vanilla planifolia]|uniref:Uncharacterized protein n=1 Tax=Vanilla planifolia TaxID=51239 RepID=A0A835RX07_VANPL|nr:hypothetical protein HPP92_004525 [Vanilla planifolia]